MVRCRFAMPLLLLAASPAGAQPEAPGAPAAVTSAGKYIFLPPPAQWDHAMLNDRPALQQTATDFASLTGGIAFGMSPGALNARLAERNPSLSWDVLPPANEYPVDVRYFAMPIEAAGTLRMGVTACTGSLGNLNFLFSPRGLFRLSYRLPADPACPDTNTAAQQIFARYVAISQAIALSVRYETGRTAVVDITDPASGLLAPVRWSQGGN